MAREKILGEGFRALELRCGRARPENSKPGGFEAIDDTGHQRCLGADDGQLDGVGRCEFEQAVDILGADIDVVDAFFEIGTGVTRGHVDPVRQRRFPRLPRQRVFAPAASNYQYLH